MASTPTSGDQKPPVISFTQPHNGVTALRGDSKRGCAANIWVPRELPMHGSIREGSPPSDEKDLPQSARRSQLPYGVVNDIRRLDVPSWVGPFKHELLPRGPYAKQHSE